MGLHDENGGIYQMFFSDDNSGSIEKIVNNGASICNKMRSLKEDFHGYAHAPTDSLQNKSFGSILNSNSGS